MRNPIPFDTHAYVKRLTGVGVSEAQAEVQAEALADLVYGRLVTKEDLQQGLQALEQRMEQRFAEVDMRFVEIERRFGDVEKRFGDVEKLFGDIETRIAQLELRLTLRLGVMLAASMGIVAALVKLL
jgi:hypothetical protein